MRLEAQALYMDYGTTVALNYVDLNLTPGIYGLLGANGAGKSTLIKILTGNLKPTSGDILLNGKEIKSYMDAYLGCLGYVPQKQGMYPGMTAQQFLAYMAELKEIPKKEAVEQIEFLLRRVHLYEVRDQRLGGFSGGMKQRILIAQALLGNPSIVILDEPPAGLDPKERFRIRNLISELSFQKIVLIATHVVTDIEFISKEILILNKGNLIRQGTPDELLKELDGKVWTVGVTEEAYGKLAGQEKISNVKKQNDRIYVRLLLEDGEEVKRKYPDAVAEKPDLEDLYLYLFEREEEGVWKHA